MNAFPIVPSDGLPRYQGPLTLSSSRVNRPLEPVHRNNDGGSDGGRFRY